MIPIYFQVTCSKVKVKLLFWAQFVVHFIYFNPLVTCFIQVLLLQRIKTWILHHGGHRCFWNISCLICRSTGSTWKPLNPVSPSWGNLGTRWVGGDTWNTSVNPVTTDVLKGRSTWSRYGWDLSDTCPGYFVKLNTTGIYFLVCRTFIFFFIGSDIEWRIVVHVF